MTWVWCFVDEVETSTMMRDAAGAAAPLDELEAASGVPWGLDPFADPLPSPHAPSARAALEEEVRAALARPPCVVAFSGGRDSSAILALAVTVARREGLAMPIAVTWRFPGYPETDETQWQEIVVRHLGLSDWERLSFDDELELLGETATDGLLTHGLLWPPNLHLHAPVLDRARGGSMLTGWDGDGLFSGWRFGRAQAVMHGRARPEPRDILRVGYALAPGPVRRLRGGAKSSIATETPWLHPEAAREMVDRLRARRPRRYDRWIGWYARQRYLRLAVYNLDVVARARRVSVHHPLAADHFLAALAREGGAAGTGVTRTEMMSKLFEDLLPGEILTRRSKARFDQVLWGPRSRTFARDWDGAGVDPKLVNHERLRAAWRAEKPLYGSGTVLQSAWLHSHDAGAQRGI